jgi:hypothetical protein
MRKIVAVIAGLAVLAPGAAAQGREGRDARGVAAAAVNLYNAEGTTRVIGAYDLPAGRTVEGNVGVVNGPVVIAGSITGSLVVINADVRLASGSRIGRDLLVVGGVVRRDDGAAVGGEVRTQLELLHYELDGDRLSVGAGFPGDWRPRLDGPWRDQREEYTELFFIAARTYNRVEGLPVLIGPRFRRPTDWGRVQVEALGVVRTAGPIRWDRGTIGHDARAEIRLGVSNGLVLGGRLFDVVEPVESWQLTEPEAGLATFLLHRDLRDHYGRHGTEGTFGGRLGEEASLHAVFGSERWRSMPARRPISLLRDDRPWRLNAEMDEGTIDLLGLRLNIDTRERLRSPWTGGWYVKADLERGRGTIARAPAIGEVATGAEEVNYTRGFLDARRYTKLSPGTALNLRIVLGGQLGGDQLPLQRRLSIGGPGSVEGYDFRRAPYDDDVFTCGGIADRDGRATQCDRIALAQLELRQNFELDFVRSDRSDDWWRPGFNGRGAWVLFADAGRGWSVGTGDPEIRHDRGLPPLSSFRVSLGTGVDFGPIGFYLAKATSTKKERVNFLVRLGRRF